MPYNVGRATRPSHASQFIRCGCLRGWQHWLNLEGAYSAARHVKEARPRKLLAESGKVRDNPTWKYILNACVVTVVVVADIGSVVGVGDSHSHQEKRPVFTSMYESPSWMVSAMWLRIIAAPSKALPRMQAACHTCADPRKMKAERNAWSACGAP
eukprot:363789-Chlamydomonas_euryale.AAC.14